MLELISERLRLVALDEQNLRLSIEDPGQMRANLGLHSLAVEPQPEAEDQPELGLEEGVPEPVGEALEQAVLEKLSDEKLEEIVTRIAKRTIEGKVERILLEAAEAAIAKEIDRLKQAI